MKFRTHKEELYLILRKNKINIPFKLNFYWGEKIRLMNILRKLGYVKKLEPNLYIKLKTFPKNFDWRQAEIEARRLPKLDNRGRLKGSKWSNLVESINNTDKEYVMIHPDYFAYSGILNSLGYLTRDYSEELPRHHYFKINKKIPDSLSSTLAKKLLYDKYYNRALKLKRLKDKL